MEQTEHSMKVAGIDVGKRHLDVALHGCGDVTRVSNDEAGIATLLAWLSAREVGRVGMEASGGYQRLVCERLQSAGCEVVVHKPEEVRAFAVFKRMKAKNDRMDARVIAAATAHAEALRAASDPRLVELAERLTAYEQATDRLAEQKTQLEHVTLPDLKALLDAQIALAEAHKAALFETVVTLIRAHDDLAARYKLALSLPGVGPVVAAGLVVRMPELGSMARGQAAALVGVAPFDRESGQYKGHRFIAGGRGRVRRMLYLAALAARRSNPAYRDFADRLAAAGKPPKVILVAIMRKLIELANVVFARGKPWVKTVAA
jgi:transposase